MSAGFDFLTPSSQLGVRFFIDTRRCSRHSLYTDASSYYEPKRRMSQRRTDYFMVSDHSGRIISTRESRRLRRSFLQWPKM